MLSKSEREFTYKELFYAVYEQKLQENDIKRVNLYDFSKLLDTVHKNYNINYHINDNKENDEIESLNIPILKSKLPKVLTNLIIGDFKNQG